MIGSDEAGLALFDDTASAAGNFPTALRGYDRSSVDEYVRALESAAVRARRHTAALEQRLAQLQAETVELRATIAARVPEDDVTRVGGRTAEILKLAEDQAADIVGKATAEAERTLELARREAEETRRRATRDHGDLTSAGLAEIKALRVQLEEESAGAIAKARSEAEAIVAAARRQSETARRQADHEAQEIRRTALLDTEKHRRAAEVELAELRRQIATDRDLAIGEIRSQHEEHAARTAALLAEAAEHNRASAERLEADIAAAEKIRREALLAAQEAKAAATQEAEKRIAAAKQEAEAIAQRTQQEFAWRRDQLRRETEQLGRRKQAVLSQLASLSALAEETAQSFPEVEDIEFGVERSAGTTAAGTPTPPPAPTASPTPAPTAAPTAGGTGGPTGSTRRAG